MPKLVFKTALNTSKLPFSHLTGPTGVLVAHMDVASRQPGAAIGKSDNLDENIINVVFAQNVLPTAKGYVSCGFEAVIGAFVGEDAFAPPMP